MPLLPLQSPASIPISLTHNTLNTPHCTPLHLLPLASPPSSVRLTRLPPLPACLTSFSHSFIRAFIYLIQSCFWITLFLHSFSVFLYFTHSYLFLLPSFMFPSQYSFILSFFLISSPFLHSFFSLFLYSSIPSYFFLPSCLFLTVPFLLSYLFHPTCLPWTIPSFNFPSLLTYIISFFFPLLL